MGRLDGKVCVITGAASGIGCHWAAALSVRPDLYRLVLADVNERGLRARFRPGRSVRLHAFDVDTLGQEFQRL